MKVRKLTVSGDYRLGHGDKDFLIDNAEGVAQNVMTRLALWQGQWFINNYEGTSWIQHFLDKHNAVDQVIRTRIFDTPGVLTTLSYKPTKNKKV